MSDYEPIMDKSPLEREMIRAMRETLGNGYVDEYYEVHAQDFIDIAKHYLNSVRDEVRDETLELMNKRVNEARKETYLAQSKRAELLQVATQLAAGICNSLSGDVSLEHFKEVNKFSVEIAKDLIAKVDKELGE